MKDKALTDSQKWLVLTCVLFFGAVVYLLAPVLTPFLAGTLLAYLGDPLVDRLERRGLQRTAAVSLVFSFMVVVGIAGLVIALPLLERQVVALIGAVPQLLDWIQQMLMPQLSALLGAETLTIDTAEMRRTLLAHWQEMGSFAGRLVTGLGASGQLLLGWLAYLVLVPVVTFYLMRDWDPLVRATYALIPKRYAPTVSQLAQQIDRVLAEFLRGQLSLMAALAAIYALGLWLVGLDLAFVIGTLAGLVSFVPYLGVIVGLAAAGVAAFLQFHDLAHFLGVLAVFGVGQVLEAVVLSPYLVGERIGLHPVAVIFAVMAGGQLFGFFGVLLALPAAAAIVVLLRFTRDQYVQSTLYD